VFLLINAVQTWIRAARQKRIESAAPTAGPAASS